MKPLKIVTDILLWTAWIVSATVGDTGLLAVLCLTSVTVVVARHDWGRGVRPFDKINAQ